MRHINGGLLRDKLYLYRMNAKEIVSVNCSNQNVPSKKAQNSAEKLYINQAENC
jgi:hypothetical protein